MRAGIRVGLCAVVLAGLGSCSNTNTAGRLFSAPADYVKVSCEQGTEARNTHRSCSVEATFNWAENDGRRHAKTLTIPAGASLKVIPSGCATLVTADFLTPVCN